MSRIATRSQGDLSMPNALARMRVALPCVALLLFASTATAQGAVLRGSPKADHLTGTAGADTINGRGGRDRIDGKAGADKLNGGPGSDRITADGSDRVAAGPGDDRIALTATELAFRVNCGTGKDVVTITEIGRESWRERG